MPQAMERLLATPMMSPRLPCIRVPAGTLLSAPGALIRSFLVVGCDARRAGSLLGILYTIGSLGPPGLPLVARILPTAEGTLVRMESAGPKRFRGLLE